MFQRIRALSRRIHHGSLAEQVNVPKLRAPLITPRKLIRRAPLRKLAPKTEAIRQQIGNLLVANPDWKTHRDDRCDLRFEVFQELERYSRHYPVNKLRNVLSIEDLASLRFAKELHTVLNVFDTNFLSSYNLEKGKSLSQAITEKHATKLRLAIKAVFSINSIEQRRLLASVMDPAVLTWARVPMNRDELLRVDALREQQAAVLTLDESLALFDYLDPYSAHFIIVNGGARLKAFWGIDGIAEAGTILSEPFNSALRKLQLNVQFIDRSGIYYKGFNAQEREYQHDKLMLDYLTEQNGIVILPHAISTSRIAGKSFARNDARDEDAEIVIHTATGIDVSLFHTELGKPLGEVILMPEPLQMQPKSSSEAKSRRPVCYTAHSMKGNASGEPRWRDRFISSEPKLPTDAHCGTYASTAPHRSIAAGARNAAPCGTHVLHVAS